MAQIVLAWTPRHSRRMIMSSENKRYNQCSYRSRKTGKCQGICVVRESQGNVRENDPGSCRLQL